MYKTAFIFSISNTINVYGFKKTYETNGDNAVCHSNYIGCWFGYNCLLIEDECNKVYQSYLNTQTFELYNDPSSICGGKNIEDDGDYSVDFKVKNIETFQVIN